MDTIALGLAACCARQRLGFNRYLLPSPRFLLPRSPCLVASFLSLPQNARLPSTACSPPSPQHARSLSFLASLAYLLACAMESSAMDSGDMKVRSCMESLAMENQVSSRRVGQMRAAKAACSASKLQMRAPKKQTPKAADAPTQTAPCKIKHQQKFNPNRTMQNQAPAKIYAAARYRTQSSRLTPLHNNQWR